MMENPSPAFEALIRALDEHKRGLTEKRRNYTKNLVVQTNDEARSGMPYLVDIAKAISEANGAEAFLDGLINGLRSHSRNFGEGGAVKRALGTVVDQIKTLEPGDRNSYVSATDLYKIARFLMDSLVSVELRDAGA